MQIIRTFAVAALASLALHTVACSSDDNNSSSGNACAEAKKVADECNAKQSSDSGSSVKVTFDQAKCEAAGQQGQTMAQCVVSNRSNCDCFLACGLKGSCP